MTYMSIQWNTVANQDFFSFSGLAPFSATGPVVGTGLATSLLTVAIGFGIPEACACGCGGRGGGPVVGNGGVGSCLLASCSLRLFTTIPETSSTSSSSSSSQSAIRRRRLLPGSLQAAAVREELGATSSMPTVAIVDCTTVVALGLERAL
jgi:hypothetical protein